MADFKDRYVVGEGVPWASMAGLLWVDDRKATSVVWPSEFQGVDSLDNRPRYRLVLERVQPNAAPVAGLKPVVPCPQCGDTLRGHPCGCECLHIMEDGDPCFRRDVHTHDKPAAAPGCAHRHSNGTVCGYPEDHPVHGGFDSPRDPESGYYEIGHPYVAPEVK